MKSTLFRTDSSANIGTGHLTRCLTLADELKKRNWETLFICRNLPGNLFNEILQRGHQLLELPLEKYQYNKTNPNDYKANLGVSWEQDAKETVAVIKQLKIKPAWLVVDHYSLNKDWEERLKSSVERIFVIDDLTETSHQCDLLLNQNLLPNIERCYRDLTPKHAKLLLGPQYALLTPDYEEARKQIKIGSGSIRRILIFYGTADGSDETSNALSALASLHRPDIHLDVVLGASNPRRKTIENQIQQLENATLHIQAPSLVNLIHQADLALCAGGNTIYELLALGIPILVTTTADNQVPTIRHLSELGLLNWLGHAPDVLADQMKEELQKVLETSYEIMNKTKRGLQMVDGQGAKKVAAIMEKLSTPKPFKIGSVPIGLEAPPFIIAELSGNHNQSLDRALEITRAAAKAGAHALKLQTYTADTLTLNLKGKGFVIDDKESLWNGESLYELYKKAYTPWEWHELIMKLAHELGMICFSTPFDESAVEFLEKLNVPCYKIASFENTHIPLIRKVASTGKPIIMSTGMATIEEIQEAVDTIRKCGSNKIVLLKCTSSYPAKPDDSNVLTLTDMRNRFKCEVGLSDHTMGTGAACAAVAHRAIVIEKHFTLCRADGGVDSAFSLEPDEMKSLVVETERAWRSLGEVSYGPSEAEKASVQERRSLYIVNDMKAGDIFTKENLRCIRPGLGLPPKYYDTLLGQKIIQDAKRGTPVSWELVDQKRQKEN